MKRLLLLTLLGTSIHSASTADWYTKTKALEKDTIVSGKITAYDSQGARVLLDGDISAIITKESLTINDYLNKDKQQCFNITKIDRAKQNIEVFSVDKQFITRSLSRSFDYQTSQIHCAHITNMSGHDVECCLCYQARIFFQDEWKTTTICTKVLKMAPGKYYEVRLGNTEWSGTRPHLTALIDNHSKKPINANIVRDEYNEEVIYVTLTA